MRAPLRGTFRSLRSFNYRVWAGGALVSNVGTWMQRTAQDWLVLTQLTAPQRHRGRRGHGAAVRAAAPAAALDRLRGRPFRPAQAAVRHPGGDGRCSRSGWACSPSPALVQLWHVYVFALLLGCVAAFDAPARQTFVAELVGETDLSTRWR